MFACVVTMNPDYTLNKVYDIVIPLMKFVIGCVCA